MPSHPFSFGILREKKVTGILVIGLESQESDMYASSLEFATQLLGRQHSEPKGATLTSHQMFEKFSLINLQRLFRVRWNCS